MPAKGGPQYGSSGRVSGGARGTRIYKGYGMARETSPGSNKWTTKPGRATTPAQKSQNKSAATYKTIDAKRSAAAKQAAATRKANAAAAARDAARSNKAKGRRQGLKTGVGLGAAAGAAAGYASSYVGRGSEGSKKSVPVKRKKK
jgi:flagellar biosynthesis/type III secretory pathway protein FliH